jgi:hypothetical protein
MKRLRVACLLAVILAILAGALYFSRQPALTGFPTPADCLDAYRDACKTGEIEEYLRCLAEPLRSEKRASITPDRIRKEMQGVKSWTQLDPVVKNDTATIDVDAVRPTGARRTRFHLQRSERGWLITAIDRAKDLPSSVPYGTRAND